MRTMVGSLSEDSVATTGSRLSGMQHCQSVDSLVEWRSCDQVENGTPSTSPAYWDTDDDDDVGLKPSDLYGKFTWKIENFSQISKRELRSNAFEVGGYKWYILIYPQGCDVCDYLSLFLCVANHDKLLPGWSHFAQFTIAVVNKDTKKNKYSDTLHRFWKKEHDWGWKKFMELSKMSDGFADDDILTIKAQVQVIREKAHRPFRCLDCQYRRELIRVYVSSAEQTCRRYLEERKGKLKKLVDDKEKWSSFHAFWFGMDQSVRRGMSKDKTGTILKLVVKQFFIEKEVISTLVMDSLYSGLRVLEYQSKRNKGRARVAEKEELPAPMVVIEEDMFVLADDVFLLLERAALESLPLPPVPPKDDKVVQNRAKVGTSGDEFSRDSIVRDERNLTELGCRTLEIFVLTHIFSRIEVAYKEAVSLKRQEELIREEEAAGQAAIELKAKRSALEKEKRARKKQAKQKRCNNKGKDKGKDDKPEGAIRVKIDDLSPKEVQKVHGKFDKRGDISYVSDPVDDGDEASQADEVDKDINPHSWETITSESHPTTEASVNAMQNGKLEKKNPSSLYDSSSTSSTDSVLSVVGNGPYKNNPSPNREIKRSSSRRRKRWSKDIKTRSSSDVGQVLDANGSCRRTFPESDGKLHLKDQIHRLEEHPDEKVEVAITLEKQLIDEDEAKVETGLVPRSTELSSSFTPSRKLLSVQQPSTASTASGSLHNNEPISDMPTKVVPSAPSPTRLPLTSSISRSEHPKHITQPMTTTVHQASSMSRPSSAPLIPVTRTTASLVSTTQASPLLSRTLSTISHLVADPSSASRNYEPQSYRNAIMGIRTAKEPSSAAFTSRPFLPSSQSITVPQPHSSFSSSPSTQPSMTDARKELVSVDPGFSSVLGRPGSLCTPCQWIDSDSQSCPSQGGISDEFPHLDIINDLLDEDQIVGRTFSGYHDYHPMDPHYMFPRDSATSDISVRTGSSGHSDMFEPYYDDVSQMSYDSSALPFQLLGDALPLQLDLLAYDNGQIDARFQNQWQIGSPDMSMLSFSGNLMDMDAYSYQFSGLSACVGGYNMMYQPANEF